MNCNRQFRGQYLLVIIKYTWIGSKYLSQTINISQKKLLLLYYYYLFKKGR